MIMSTSQERPLGAVSDAVRYLASVRAHELAAWPSRPAWLADTWSWRTCPCPEACSRAGWCMLVAGRDAHIRRAQREVKEMRAGVRIVRP